MLPPDATPRLHANSPTFDWQSGFYAWIQQRPDATDAEYREWCRAQPAADAAQFEDLWRHYHAGRRLLAGSDPLSGDSLSSDPLSSDPSNGDSHDLHAAVRNLALARSVWLPGRELGRGGMCVVDEISDSRLSRRLARKRLPIQLDGRTLTGRETRRLARFVREARIASRLRHPSIPQVFEFGLDEQQQPFMVLPLVEGVDFGEVIHRVQAGDADWPLTRALQVLVTVCGAIAHAHAVGVVHRDLKPANIMVGRFGETMVLDWGLAKLMDEAGSATPTRSATDTASADPSGGPAAEPITDEVEEFLDGARTMDGEVVGTPAYLAPETVAGDPLARPAQDQFQIGATLYTLLAGRSPYADTHDSTDAVAVVRAVATRPPTSLPELMPHVPAELVAICNKAMAREAALRYPSVDDLAADLRAFLDGRVVAAHATGAWVTLRKWVARNRGLTISLATVFATIVLSLLGFVVVQHLWQRQLEATNESLRVANAESQQRLIALEAELYVNDILNVQAGMQEGKRQSELRSRLDRAPERVRGIEWHLLREQLDSAVEHYPKCGTWRIVVSPDQSSFAGCRDGRLSLWQIRPAKRLADVDVPRDLGPMAFDATGSVLLAGGLDRLHFFEVPTLRPLRTLKNGFDVKSAAFAPDGRRLFVSGRFGSVRVLDTLTGALVAQMDLADPTQNRLGIDGQRQRLAVGGWTGHVQVFDVDSYQQTHAFKTDSECVDISFGGDGTLQVATELGTIERFDLATDGQRNRVALLAGEALRVQAIGADGAWHLHARGAAVHRTDLRTNLVVQSFYADDEIRGVCLVPKAGGFLALSSGDVRLWSYHERQVRKRAQIGSDLSMIARFRDGRRVAIATLQRGLSIVDLLSCQVIRSYAVPAPRHNRLALSPDEQQVAIFGAKCPLVLVQLGDGARRPVAVPTAPADAVWNDQGLFLALPESTKLVALDGSGRLRESYDTGFRVGRIASLGRNGWLLGGVGGELALLRDGALQWQVRTAAAVSALCVSADGVEVACGLDNGHVEVRTVADGGAGAMPASSWPDASSQTTGLPDDRRRISGVLTAGFTASSSARSA